MLELDHLGRGFFDERFNGVLVGQPIRARDGVSGVGVETIVSFDDSCSPTLCRDGVTAHWIHLRDDRDADTRIDLGSGNGGSKTGCSPADEKNIVMRGVHDSPTSGLQNEK